VRLRELPGRLKAAHRGSDILPRLEHFDGWMDRAQAERADLADYDHAETVREYYDLCGELMVFGWSESLHFAPLLPHESLEESQARHQRLMIDKLELQEGMRVIDVGCGIGGPMRRVAREAGVSVLGVNYSDLQLERARALSAEAGLGHVTDFLSCSFMDMDAIADETFDRGYAIESTCHAPDKAGAFAEIYRVLRPGALFWGQEMCMTDRFAAGDSRHQAIKRDLMHGIALKDIATTVEVDRALESVGFEVIEGIDRAVPQNGTTTPWYQPMEGMGARPGRWGDAVRRIPAGRKVAAGALRLAEVLRVLPAGSADIVRLMDGTARAYVAGGTTGIFTPLYCFLARKPL